MQATPNSALANAARPTNLQDGTPAFYKMRRKPVLYLPRPRINRLTESKPIVMIKMKNTWVPVGRAVFMYPMRSLQKFNCNAIPTK